jgi:hypothetical protein
MMLFKGNKRFQFLLIVAKYVNIKFKAKIPSFICKLEFDPILPNQTSRMHKFNKAS